MACFNSQKRITCNMIMNPTPIVPKMKFFCITITNKKQKNKIIKILIATCIVNRLIILLKLQIKLF